MLNTCSIGRRWKPREGWSRPVLTGERGTLFPTRLSGRVSSCGGFFRWMARSIVSCGHGNDTGEAFLLASVVRFPDRHDRNRGMVPVPPVRWFPSDRCIGFAVVMAQVRRPVPFRTRKLRPGRGDGTALERVWESSTPPHSTLDLLVESLMGFPEGPFRISLGGSVGRDAPGTPILFVLLCRPAGRSTLPGVPGGRSEEAFWTSVRVCLMCQSA